MTGDGGRHLFLEPDGSNREEIRRLGYRFVDLLVEAGSRAGSRPPVPDDAARGNPIGPGYRPPAGGRSADELLETLRTRVLAFALNPAHPGYVGHMDSIASAIGTFSDAIVSALNNNMLSYEMSLVFTEMESSVLDWAMRSFGWGAGGRGFLVSGGTLANIQAIWVARNRGSGPLGSSGARGAGAGRSRPVFVASENAHYSFSKAANLLGIGREGLLRVPAGSDGRTTAEAFEETIERAARDGAVPFCVVGVAGTTITGSIEPLEEIGDVARRHGAWFHVDAAYGGSLFLSPRLRPVLRGIESADSITWNPQKWLFVPKACASILFRDGSVLESTVREPFIYGRETAAGDRPNLGEYTIQGTRRVDVLKLWLTLEHLGLDYLASMIERQVAQAERLAARIQSCEDLELTATPDLNIVCFRAAPPGVDRSDRMRMDALQIAVQRAVARAGHGWLSLPQYGDRRVLRAVILHPRCDDALLDRLLEDVREAGRQTAGGGTGGLSSSRAVSS